MAEMVACLHQGKVEILRRDRSALALQSPELEKRAARAHSCIVSVTRGRTSGELCYALSGGRAYDVFAQVPGSGREQRLFHGVESELSQLDFSPADEALACTVAGADGTSAIGVLTDDGKGLRTVTEGDVVDRSPRWSPGGRGELVYASAGIGRNRAGKAVGRSPFALHRLRFSDSSVEVLVTDSQYDYDVVVPAAQGVLYALRRPFDGAPKRAKLAQFAGIFRSVLTSVPDPGADVLPSHDLVRITSDGSEVLARGVFAVDVAANEDLVYSCATGVFRVAAGGTTAAPLSALERVTELVIYW